MTCTPPAHAGAAGRNSCSSSFNATPGMLVCACCIACLTFSASAARQRTTACFASSLRTPWQMRLTSKPAYAGEALTAPTVARASASMPWMASSRAASTFRRMAFSSVEYSIFFFTSTWLSLRSYSLRILCFSVSTIWSFSMLNSSSAATRISFAFSSASCLMN